MKIRAQVTSKGQITIPVALRRLLGIKKGDRLEFETGRHGVRVCVEEKASPFAKYQGIGVEGVKRGRAWAVAYVRGIRIRASNAG